MNPILLFGGGFVGVMLLILAYVASRVAATLVGKEASGWIPHISHGLVSRAARRLPEAHRARYEEEWRRHISDCEDRPLTALAKAVGYSGSVRRLRRELAPDPVGSRRHVHIFLSVQAVSDVPASQRVVRTAGVLGAVAQTTRRAGGGLIVGPLRVLSDGLHLTVRRLESLVRVAGEILRLVPLPTLPILNARQARIAYVLGRAMGWMGGAILVSLLIRRLLL